jgi:hypothetical protein
VQRLKRTVRHPRQTRLIRPGLEKREKRWLNGMVGPFAIAGDALSAGISTWNNSPPEWGKSWNGFGKRFASDLGKGVIKGSAAFALEESFKLDSHHYRSTKRDVGSHLRNALLSSFTARTPSGRRIFGFPRIAGSYVSSIVATEAWYPKRFGIRDGLRGGTWAVGADILSNIFTDFFHK